MRLPDPAVQAVEAELVGVPAPRHMIGTLMMGSGAFVCAAWRNRDERVQLTAPLLEAWCRKPPLGGGFRPQLQATRTSGNTWPLEASSSPAVHVAPVERL